MRTSQSCAQFACATEQISDPINTIRTQACQSKLVSSHAGMVIGIQLYIEDEGGYQTDLK